MLITKPIVERIFNSNILLSVNAQRLIDELVKYFLRTTKKEARLLVHSHKSTHEIFFYYCVVIEFVYIFFFAVFFFR